MPAIKYRDDMTEAELAEFRAQLDATDADYARAADDERRTRLIFNLVGCLADVLSNEGDLHSMSYDRYREVLTEAKAMGYRAYDADDVYDADDELRKAALNRGQP